MKTNTHTIQLHIEKGDVDWSGKTWSEDRYVILDEEGIDIVGEHFSKDIAEDICQDKNKGNGFETLEDVRIAVENAVLHWASTLYTVKVDFEGDLVIRNASGTSGELLTEAHFKGLFTIKK